MSTIVTIYLSANVIGCGGLLLIPGIMKRETKKKILYTAAGTGLMCLPSLYIYSVLMQ